MRFLPSNSADQVVIEGEKATEFGILLLQSWAYPRTSRLVTTTMFKALLVTTLLVYRASACIPIMSRPDQIDPSESYLGPSSLKPIPPAFLARSKGGENIAPSDRSVVLSGYAGPQEFRTIFFESTPTPDQCASRANCFQNHVFTVNVEPMNWESASAQCHIQGGNLASILSEEEGRFVTQLLVKEQQKTDKIRYSVWIGAKRMRDGQFKWMDGSPFEYDNFQVAQPNPTPGNDCMELYGVFLSKWVNYDCSRRFPSVCKIPLTKWEITEPTLLPTGPTQTAPVITSTDPTRATSHSTESSTETTPKGPTDSTTGATSTKSTDPTSRTTKTSLEITSPPTSPTLPPSPGQDLCEDRPNCFQNHIFTLNLKRLTWTIAKGECEKIGGTLASIVTKKENEFITSVLRKEEDTTHRVGNDVWIGALQVSPGKFEWLDGSPFDYMNFSWNQPNDALGNNCMEIFGSGLSKWLNYPCSREFPSICKIPLENWKAA
uniref:C-type lectin domain-containing protein n=1 Tax=Steinernema glaseri TaxID=37863 RepID=A0A1I7YLV3_9BILA